MKKNTGIYYQLLNATTVSYAVSLKQSFELYVKSGSNIVIRFYDSSRFTNNLIKEVPL